MDHEIVEMGAKHLDKNGIAICMVPILPVDGALTTKTDVGGVKSDPIALPDDTLVPVNPGSGNEMDPKHKKSVESGGNRSVSVVYHFDHENSEPKCGGHIIVAHTALDGGIKEKANEEKLPLEL